MQYKDQSFSGGDRVLDDNQYINCTFDNCRIVYRGGIVPQLISCQFESCTWQFEDAAERTVVFLHSIYHGMGEGGKMLVDSVLRKIREPDKPAGGE